MTKMKTLFEFFIETGDVHPNAYDIIRSASDVDPDTIDVDAIAAAIDLYADDPYAEIFRVLDAFQIPHKRLEESDFLSLDPGIVYRVVEIWPS